MSRLIRLIAATGAALLLVGCSNKPYEPEVVTPQDVQARIQRGDAVLLADVRSPRSYQREHIEGAVSFPIAEVSQTNRVDLPKDRWIVLYCT